MADSTSTQSASDDPSIEQRTDLATHALYQASELLDLIRPRLPNNCVGDEVTRGLFNRMYELIDVATDCVTGADFHKVSIDDLRKKVMVPT